LDFGTLDAPRFEGRTADGRRPKTPTLLVDGATLTGWPTKLALTPLLADQLADHCATSMSGPTRGCPTVPAEIPRPTPAAGPWEPRPTPEAGPCETATTWNSDHWARAH